LKLGDAVEGFYMEVKVMKNQQPVYEIVFKMSVIIAGKEQLSFYRAS
jgi:hypothetical protein